MTDIDKEMEQVREKMAKTPIETHKYNGKRYLTLDGIDQILSIVTSEGKVCDECEGIGDLISKIIGKSPCPNCHGTGKLPPVTIDDAIKEKLGG